MEFSAPVQVAGKAALSLTVGSHQRPAAFVDGSGTTLLRFAYEVVVEDWDEDGVSLPADSLSGDIHADPGQPVDPSYEALPAQEEHRGAGHRTVDGGGPSASLRRRKTGRPYRIGETVEVSVELSGTVQITGTPTLPLTIGRKARNGGVRRRRGHRGCCGSPTGWPRGTGTKTAWRLRRIRFRGA